jgi:hypothetical protein
MKKTAPSNLAAIAFILFLMSCKKEFKVPDKTTPIISSKVESNNISYAGIGGYNLADPADKIISFDYEHSGKQDYMLLYRPSHRNIWILKHVGLSFLPVYQSDLGIGGYNLASPYDVIFSFDYNHSGKRDHLVLYRPGDRIVWILKNTNGVFTPVFQSTTGIGGYDLGGADRLFAYDYDHTGKLDHIVAHRQGGGIIWILKNVNGQFSPVYSSTHGIAGYAMSSYQDLGTAFDFEGSGKSDDLLFYNPPASGPAGIQVISNTNGMFSTISFTSFFGRPDTQELVPFDYAHTGKMNYLACYKGVSTGGAFYLLTSTTGQLSSFGGLSSSIAGYSFNSSADRISSFDFEHSGMEDYLILYRPGQQTITIVRHLLTGWYSAF